MTSNGDAKTSPPLAGGIKGGLGPIDCSGGESPPLTPPASGRGAETDFVSELGEKVVAQLRTVFDPEIPVNIYDLGLIYSIDLKPLEDGKVDARIEMTLTTPNCPVAGEMPGMVQTVVAKLDEINQVDVNLVWDPPWDRTRMSDEAKLQLNMF